jgi:TRAP transporter 4TM/12TM fusion protein
MMMNSAADPTARLRWVQGLRSALSLAILAFGIWSVETWQLDDAVIRSVFLAFTLVFTFAFFPAGKGNRSPVSLTLDAAAIVLSLAVTLYIALGFEEVFARAGAVTRLDLAVAAVAVVFVLETTRRTTGWALPVLSVMFLLYPLVYGPYLPGLLRTAAFGVERVLTDQYLSLDGLLGPAFKVMIEFIFLFIILGAFLQRLGFTEFFIDLAKTVAGTTPGGSAKVAVVASSLMGTVSGSAVANVVTTGVITIPMMRREGYRASYAGAVEAAASTGGQIMPPVMGAAAFLMAEFSHIPYSRIIIHALVPAFAYYATIWLAVHFEARRIEFPAASGDAVQGLGLLLKQRGAALLPFIFLTGMIVAGQPLPDSVLLTLILTIVVSWLIPKTRHLVTLRNLVAAVDEGVNNSIALFTASACAGIIIGIVSLTGLGLKISMVIVDVSQGIPIVALALSAVTCLIMGLGLPTQIIYLTLAILVAPGLIDMHITVIGAHLFIMYFGMMSMVTPPVCFAAFAAASLSGAKLMETGMIAFRLALAGQLVPFYFALNPGLLLLGSPAQIAEALIRVCIGLYAAGAAFEIFTVAAAGRRTTSRASVYLRRIVFGAVAILLVFPGLPTTLIGLGLFGTFVLAGRVRRLGLNEAECSRLNSR